MRRLKFNLPAAVALAGAIACAGCATGPDPQPGADQSRGVVGRRYELMRDVVLVRGRSGSSESLELPSTRPDPPSRGETARVVSSGTRLRIADVERKYDPWNQTNHYRSWAVIEDGALAGRRVRCDALMEHAVGVPPDVAEGRYLRQWGETPTATR